MALCRCSSDSFGDVSHCPWLPEVEAVDQKKGAEREFFVTGRRRARACLQPILVDPTASDCFFLLKVIPCADDDSFRGPVQYRGVRGRGSLSRAERRDVILLAAEDRERLGLQLDQRVTVSSSAGSMSMLVRDGRIKAGNAAMYYPGANVLVPEPWFGLADTGFQNVAIQLAAQAV